MFPLEKYTFKIYHTPKGIKTIAKQTYKGQPVYGYALCVPGDEYDEQVGKEIAAAKCNLKIAAKRQKASKQRLAAFYDIVQDYNALYHREEEFFKKAQFEWLDAIANLTDIMDKHRQ